MPASEDTWAEARRAYVETDEKMEVIAERLGLNPRTIRHRASREGWPRRRAAGLKTPATVKRVTPAETEAARGEVVLQLYLRMSERLARMERTTPPDGIPPSADDPDDRMLTSLIRQFEKLTGLHALVEPERTPGAQSGTPSRSKSGRKRGDRDETKHDPARDAGNAAGDAAELRRQIVDRLERLQRERRDRPTAE